MISVVESLELASDGSWRLDTHVVTTHAGNAAKGHTGPWACYRKSLMSGATLVTDRIGFVTNLF